MSDVRSWQRLAVGVLLVAGIVALGSYYEATEEARSTYPTAAELDADYGEHAGMEALLFGTVESRDGPTAHIRVTDDTHEFTVRVDGLGAPVERGGVVMVYGTLGPEYTMTVRGATVVNPGANTNLKKYVISAAAALVFLAVFFRDWRLDVRTLTLRRRQGSAGTGGGEDG